MGEELDSDKTPRGMHYVADMVGKDIPLGMVLVDRIPTGEIVQSHIPGRWPVTTRVIRLGGLEQTNMNTFERNIYIHGTPLEHLLGKPASGGCIRMKAIDVIELFDAIKVGTKIYISETSFAQL